MPNTQRKLAAVMFTDIIGYTALMQSDEAYARALRIRQRGIIETMRYKHHGTVVQTYGDGNLILFDSAVDAVRCGIAIQQQLQTDPAVPLRIGIHMGEVVQDDEGVYGDSVNVASRIESLSMQGAVLISGKVNDELHNQSDCATIALGDFKMKNVRKPVRVYAVEANGLLIPDAAMLYSPKAKRLRSVAVLPFVNMSNDDNTEYFSDGITEEIINALVRIDGLRVTARTSSFAFKGRNEDIRTIGKALGVKLRAGGQRAQGRQPHTHYRTAHRHGRRIPSLL